ncbi:penicillin-binding protein 2 [Roseospira marina]|uniref:Penicillin-binding protein 2 n=1 Tax=Roseospira marina TaxID=140057 RepID=A0A5M6IAU2_9PROT|nr:penicillin-binding protein 2 [Roseospira marina]KAA5604855.1 penicillin-binding protein 2 [Roseospira marina]MBB4315189.1 penicillin-binding protein 2 [Roseospira marina]MBB5088189.1 penicillin-binding protein 2 [Roseospira marina]
MQKDGDRSKVFTRRVVLLAGGKALLVTLLGARMYYLQVMEAEKYRTLAEENRINMRLIPPPRGRIVDRHGVPLAVNRQNFRALVIAERTRDLEQTLATFGRLVPLTDYDRQRVIKEIKRRRSFVPVAVRENLTWEQMAIVQVHAPDLPGVSIDEGLTRDYPYADMASHILGYVASVSEEDIDAGNDPLLQLPDFRIGKAGIEKVYDLPLRGTSGTSQVEVNAVGRMIRELRREDGEPGHEVQLTLDMRLQDYVSRRLGDESAACVVMDVHTGELLAMSSMPAYDPNAFARGLSNAEWGELAGNPRAPLRNKALAGQYSPGSTFKMVVALAALESGIMTPEQTVYCPGFLQLGNHRFHCWKRWGHGHMNLTSAIEQSCDVYFYEVSRRIGIERIAEMANRLGLGAPLNIELPGEAAGLIPTKAWKSATLGQPWVQGETLVASIGQGYVLATPLQLAVMTARIANDGLAVRPTLSRQAMVDGSLQEQPTPAFETLGISRSSLAVVRNAMWRVLNGNRGTARASAIDLDGITMAGKTGTSQVRRISMQERQSGVRGNDELPWKYRDHALFVAYAPAEAPRYAISVIVEHAGGGSRYAAPIAHDVMMETLRLDPSRRRAPEELAAIVDNPPPTPAERQAAEANADGAAAGPDGGGGAPTGERTE